MKVVVTGGTGLLGRSVVGRLVANGHRVSVVSRDPARAPAVPSGVELRRGDLRHSAGLRSALSSADVVVHCASDLRAAGDVDVAGTANLLDAMRGQEVAHLVYVSIVGVDRIPLRYYRAKREAEASIEGQSIPWTIQRATQFHPFIETRMAASARKPFIACPRRLRFQPVAVDTVADRLVQHVAAGPAGMAPDLGGPEVLTQRELASTWLSAVGRRRALLPAPLVGRVGQAFHDGANLCPDRASAGPTWQQHLARAQHVRGVR